METVQVGTSYAEILRNLGLIADDEDMLTRVSKYLRRLVKQKEDATLMSKDDFFRRVDESKRQYERGEYVHFSDKEEMTKWLNTL